jgi:hypothetical protein
VLRSARAHIPATECEIVQCVLLGARVAQRARGGLAQVRIGDLRAWGWGSGRMEVATIADKMALRKILSAIVWIEGTSAMSHADCFDLHFVKPNGCGVDLFLSHTVDPRCE